MMYLLASGQLVDDADHAAVNGGLMHLAGQWQPECSICSSKREQAKVLAPS